MDWKDTVMSEEEMDKVGDYIGGCEWGNVEALAEAQAEISFKAGMKEVVDFAIQKRQEMKEEKIKQKTNKPDDIQTQITIGAKMKAFQQIIDKGLGMINVGKPS